VKSAGPIRNAVQYCLQVAVIKLTRVIERGAAARQDG
jgi:hypothetical protein